MLVTYQHFLLSQSVFKSLLPQGCSKSGLCGEGISGKENTGDKVLDTSMATVTVLVLENNKLTPYHTILTKQT